MRLMERPPTAVVVGAADDAITGDDVPIAEGVPVLPPPPPPIVVDVGVGGYVPDVDDGAAVCGDSVFVLKYCTVLTVTRWPFWVW